MGAVLGDLIQCVDNQSYLGQQILNVYYYRVTSVTPLAGDYLSSMNDSWEGGVLDNVKIIQTPELLHLSREWRNLTNGTDLFVDGSVVPGVDPASAASLTPSFTSLGFLLQRESLVTRNGYKRYGGISEGNISGNTYVGGMGTIHDIEVGLAADLTAGIITIAEPVIVKRPISVPVTSYLYSSIGSAIFRGVGTQNTRKAGRGV